MSFTLQGEFEIISLSGFTEQSENNNGHNGMRSLNVSLAGPDGRVLGGEVSGALTAASAVQVSLSKGGKYVGIFLLLL